MKRRAVDVAIISDCHLGTPQCRADTLLNYLDSITPRRLIINGDLFDLSMGSAKYYNDYQQAVIERLLQIADFAHIDYGQATMIERCGVSITLFLVPLI